MAEIVSLTSCSGIVIEGSLDSVKVGKKAVDGPCRKD